MWRSPRYRCCSPAHSPEVSWVRPTGRALLCKQQSATYKLHKEKMVSCLKTVWKKGQTNCDWQLRYNSHVFDKLFRSAIAASWTGISVDLAKTTTWPSPGWAINTDTWSAQQKKNPDQFARLPFDGLKKIHGSRETFVLQKVFRSGEKVTRCVCVCVTFNLTIASSCTYLLSRVVPAQAMLFHFLILLEVFSPRDGWHCCAPAGSSCLHKQDAFMFICWTFLLLVQTECTFKLQAVEFLIFLLHFCPVFGNHSTLCCLPENERPHTGMSPCHEIQNRIGDSVSNFASPRKEPNDFLHTSFVYASPMRSWNTEPLLQFVSIEQKQTKPVWESATQRWFWKANDPQQLTLLANLLPKFGSLSLRFIWTWKFAKGISESLVSAKVLPQGPWNEKNVGNEKEIVKDRLPRYFFWNFEMLQKEAIAVEEKVSLNFWNVWLKKRAFLRRWMNNSKFGERCERPLSCLFLLHPPPENIESAKLARSGVPMHPNHYEGQTQFLKHNWCQALSGGATLLVTLWDVTFRGRKQFPLILTHQRVVSFWKRQADVWWEAKREPIQNVEAHEQSGSEGNWGLWPRENSEGIGNHVKVQTKMQGTWGPRGVLKTREKKNRIPRQERELPTSGVAQCDVFSRFPFFLTQTKICCVGLGCNITVVFKCSWTRATGTKQLKWRKNTDNLCHWWIFCLKVLSRFAARTTVQPSQKIFSSNAKLIPAISAAKYNTSQTSSNLVLWLLAFYSSVLQEDKATIPLTFVTFSKTRSSVGAPVVSPPCSSPPITGQNVTMPREMSPHWLVAPPAPCTATAAAECLAFVAKSLVCCVFGSSVIAHTVCPRCKKIVSFQTTAATFSISSHFCCRISRNFGPTRQHSNLKIQQQEMTI